ncbi:MAG TPA: AgmX/PglI C-terminal domain-containing protein [Polyangiaceae bacterium]|jgi:TonB family protein|nr:AgmX/PglI C-terminal domain-containing protein [Polyangiaceae bacterium]
MSQYRDELEAARHRIETLEAQLREREASLDARDAELAERRAEVERLRRSSVSPVENRIGAISGGRIAAIVLVGASAAILSVGVAVALVSDRSASDPGDVVEAPAPVKMVPLQPDPPRSFEPPAPLPSAVSEPPNLAILREAFDASRPEVRKCYEKELQKRPNASGTVRVTIAVAAKGGVESVTLGESPVRSATLDACLIKNFKGLKIPELEGGATTVTYPLVFTVPAKDPFETIY